jgi:HEAT repeat protein
MSRVLVALVCVLLAAGCEGVTEQSIAQWKTTQKGPGKLQDAVKDSSVPPRLRAAAAAALVDIGMAEEAEQALATVPAGDRWEIMKTLVPAYTAEMKNPSLAKARAARDALFSARAYAPPEEQKQIDAVLLPAIEKDLREGRVSGGRHSIDKVLAAIGPAASPMLVSLLEDPRVPFPGVVEQLERTADQTARERGGAALVKRAQASGEIAVPLWRAIGSVGGKSASAFLVQKVKDGSEREAVAAAQALQLRRDPSLLPLALQVAGDPRANKAVRDEMFGLAEKIGGPEAQRGLVKIIASDPAELVRYRAYEAALAVGKGEAIAPALEAFPPQATYKKEDVVDFLVRDITKLGPEAKGALARVLGSRSALARMTAVLAYEAPFPSDPKKSLGTAADAPAVLRLSGDKGTVKGFPSGQTVGREASRVAAVLQKRVGS